MPSWKKVIVSGSDASLNSLIVPSITGSLQGTSSFAITSSYSLYAETASISNATTLTQLSVINQTGNTINKGIVVRISGSNNASDIPRITTASYESSNISANTLGIASQQITNDSQGYIITEGVLTGIDTSNYTSGTLLFLGATGSITNIVPVAPLRSVRLGQVIRQHLTNGSIAIRVDNGYELDELHNILDTTTTASYGDLLVRSGSVWINSNQLTGSYGLTGSLTITGSSLPLVAITSNTTSATSIVQFGSGNTFVPRFNFRSDGFFSWGQNATGSSYGFLSWDTNKQIIGAISSSNLSLFTNDSERMTISSSGLIGIGTTTPSAPLHIKPPAPTTDGQNSIMIETNAGRGINLISDLYNTNQSVTTFGRLQSSMAAFLAYGVNQTGSAVSGYQSSQNAFANRPVALELGNAYFALKYNTSSLNRTYGTTVSMSTSLYMDGTTGRLGVGTQTPQAIFHISSSGYTEQYPFIVGFNQLVVSSSGYVGIGTAVPAANLEVYSTSDSVASVNSTGNSYLKLKRGSINADAHISFDTTTTQKHIVGLINNTDSLIVGGTEATPVITISGSNVGIGILTPSASLHTMGSVIVSGSMIIGSGSLGPNENTLTLGARDNGSEGGQLGFNAPGGTYTSASVIDLYQNRLRIKRGTNTGSTEEAAWWSMHNLQMALPAYTSATSFTGTAAGYLAFDSSGNVITTAGVGSAVNISNSDLTITSNATRTLSHAGTSRFIITGSNSSYLLELQSSTIGNGRGMLMRQLINDEPNRFATRATTAGGNDANSTTFNGWASDHLAEYVSGSSVAPSKLKGWLWSYYNGAAAYTDILLISTSNEVTLSGSLTVTGSTLLPGTTQGSYGNVVLIDTGSGKLYYTASSAIGNSGSVAGSGSANYIARWTPNGTTLGTSLINDTGTRLGYGTTADTGAGTTHRFNIGTNTDLIALGITADSVFGTNAPTGMVVNVTGNYTSGNPTGFSVYNSANANANRVGGNINVTGTGSFSNYGLSITANGGFGGNYALLLSDGSESVGRYLKCVGVNGQAQWADTAAAFPYTGSAQITGSLSVTGSTNINGNTAITGSLTVTGNLGGSGGNIDMSAMIQASLLYLSNNF